MKKKCVRAMPSSLAHLPEVAGEGTVFLSTSTPFPSSTEFIRREGNQKNPEDVIMLGAGPHTQKLSTVNDYSCNDDLLLIPLPHHSWENNGSGPLSPIGVTGRGVEGRRMTCSLEGKTFHRTWQAFNKCSIIPRKSEWTSSFPPVGLRDELMLLACLGYILAQPTQGKKL